MAQTADHLVVIGRGRLLANQRTYDFVKENSSASVVVRSEHLREFGSALKEAGVTFRESVDEEQRPTLVIPHQTTDYVGKLAYSTGVPLTELTLHRASLEEAYVAMTDRAVQYQAEAPQKGAQF